MLYDLFEIKCHDCKKTVCFSAVPTPGAFRCEDCAAYEQPGKQTRMRIPGSVKEK